MRGVGALTPLHLRFFRAGGPEVFPDWAADALRAAAFGGLPLAMAPGYPGGGAASARGSVGGSSARHGTGGRVSPAGSGVGPRALAAHHQHAGYGDAYGTAAAAAPRAPVGAPAPRAAAPPPVPPAAAPSTGAASGAESLLGGRAGVAGALEAAFRSATPERRLELTRDAMVQMQRIIAADAALSPQGRAGGGAAPALDTESAAAGGAAASASASTGPALSPPPTAISHARTLSNFSVSVREVPAEVAEEVAARLDAPLVSLRRTSGPGAGEGAAPAPVRGPAGSRAVLVDVTYTNCDLGFTLDAAGQRVVAVAPGTQSDGAVQVGDEVAAIAGKWAWGAQVTAAGGAARVLAVVSEGVSEQRTLTVSFLRRKDAGEQLAMHSPAAAASLQPAPGALEAAAAAGAGAHRARSKPRPGRTACSELEPIPEGSGTARSAIDVEATAPAASVPAPAAAATPLSPSVRGGIGLVLKSV
jgi:hypothetical protein